MGARDLSDQGVHLARSARRGHLRTLEVSREIEVGILDPDRVMDASRYFDDATAEGRKEMETLLQFFAELLERVPALDAARVDDADLQRVHVERRGLHVEEARVHPRHALHGRQSHTRTARSERAR